MGISIGGNNSIEELTDAIDALRDSIDKLLASNQDLAIEVDNLRNTIESAAD